MLRLSCAARSNLESAVGAVEYGAASGAAGAPGDVQLHNTDAELDFEEQAAAAGGLGAAERSTVDKYLCVCMINNLKTLSKVMSYISCRGRLGLVSGNSHEIGITRQLACEVTHASVGIRLTHSCLQSMLTGAVVPVQSALRQPGTLRSYEAFLAR